MQENAGKMRGRTTPNTDSFYAVISICIFEHVFAYWNIIVLLLQNSIDSWLNVYFSECNCNNLAEKCEFDEILWLESNHTTGGRCLNCKNNTDGPHCERCKDYYFRTSTANACEPCDCDPIGSISLSCDDKGKCKCQIGVTGEKCDKCDDGFVDFSSTGCR